MMTVGVYAQRPSLEVHDHRAPDEHLPAGGHGDLEWLHTQNPESLGMMKKTLPKKPQPTAQPNPLLLKSGNAGRRSEQISSAVEKITQNNLFPMKDPHQIRAQGKPV
ncbi:hypothetical protein Salat_2115000 [Sesamum alatum]|uniref:Uncharacterized protein n=1 Tax=Sesamum alatum TaxID=300844 RepID=A0AAE1Y0Z7_9LAMI|nr:hypothetical protein Salat_2115000 [Sesamum alatum]